MLDPPLVREHCKSEHKRQKAIYDEKIHGKPFDLGDNVWLHSPAIPRGQSKKLYRPWKGPFKVVERFGGSVYKIKGPKGYQCVHFDRLKPYQGENREFQSEAPPSQRFTEQQLIPEDPPPRTPAAKELLDDDEEEQQLDGQANEDQPEVAPAADPPAVAPAADPPPGHRYPAREHRVLRTVHSILKGGSGVT